MTTAGQVTRSVERFNDFGRALSRSDHANFENSLAIFLNFCKTDAVFSKIHDQLVDVPTEGFDEWFKRCSEKSLLTLPLDEAERTGLLYEILRRINEKKPDVLNFAVHFFRSSGGRIDPMLSSFSEVITQPFLELVRYRLDEMIETLPGEPRSEVSPSMIQIFNAHSIVNQSAMGSNISQSAHQANTEIERNFDALIDELKSCISDQIKLKDQLELVEAARAQATTAAPKRSVVSALLASLEPIGKVVSITATILGMLG